jgi:hypothetical protein
MLEERRKEGQRGEMQPEFSDKKLVTSVPLL